MDSTFPGKQLLEGSSDSEDLTLLSVDGLAMGHFGVVDFRSLNLRLGCMDTCPFWLEMHPDVSIFYALDLL